MSENGLPPGWTSAPLGTFADILGGSTPPRAEPDNFGGDIAWLTPTEIPKQTVSIVSDSKEKLTEKGLASGGIRWIPKGSVLMTSRASIGFVAIAGERLTTNQGFASFVLRDGMEPKFLGWWLRSQKSRLEDEAGGTTFKEISKAKLRNIPAPIAPTNEQRRIVAAIEEQFALLDAGVAALERTRANLKRYRASVLKAAVEGHLTERWREEHPDVEYAETLLERILEERRTQWEKGQLAKYAEKERNQPKDWRTKYKVPAAPDYTDLPLLPTKWFWTRAEQVCGFITKGTTPTAAKLHNGSGDVPFIKVYNLTFDGSLNFQIQPTFVSAGTHAGELARSRVLPGDVLMNIVGPPLGKVSVVPDLHSEWNMNQAIAVFRSMPSYNRKFLCLSLLSETILAWAKRRAKATAGQFNLTLEICRDLPLPLPPLAEQKEIVAEVERRLSVAEGVQAQVEAGLKRAARLRQAILKRAFEGKLVPQDPSDEPADALLERICAERERPIVKKTKQKKPTKRNAKAAQTSLFSTEGG